MNLTDIIKGLDYNNLNDSEIWNILNLKNVLHLDEDPWTWAGIAEVVGNQGAEELRIALTNGGMGWAVHQLGGKGINLSKEDVQNALYYLHSIGVPGMAALAMTVKRNISILEKFNISTTNQEVKQIIKNIKLQDLKDLKIEVVLDKVQLYREELTLWDGNPETEPKLWQ
jgi:hypothetical protein